MIPAYVHSDDRTTDRVMLAAWLVSQGEPVGYGIAQDAVSHIDPAVVRSTLDTVAGLYSAVVSCQDDPAHYAREEGIYASIPWVDWAELEVEQLLADALVNVLGLIEPWLVRAS